MRERRGKDAKLAFQEQVFQQVCSALRISSEKLREEATLRNNPKKKEEGIYLPFLCCLLSLGQGLSYVELNPLNSQVVSSRYSVTIQINFTLCGVAISFKSGSGEWLPWVGQ